MAWKTRQEYEAWKARDPAPSPAPRAPWSWKKRLGVGTLVVFGLAAGITALNPDKPAPSREPVGTAQATLPALTGFSWHSEGGLRYLVGTVTNPTAKTFRYVQVSFSLYDKQDGNLVGSTFANVNYLQPGGTWKFKALVFEDQATFARAESLTAY